MSYAIGIDIGGTNIKALAVSRSGKVLAELAAPTCGAKPKDWLKNTQGVFEGLMAGMKTQPACCGIAAPGLAAPDEKAIQCMPGRLPGLEGLVWSKALKTDFHIPVLNDAHAALLGERWIGAARNESNALLLTLGTGVGGAAVVDGRLLRGNLGRAGHFGHLSLDPEGEPDITGTPGSLEDAIGECTLPKRTARRYRTTEELVKSVRLKDPAAVEIWHKSIRALAASLCGLINAMDPAVIVIGGGISKAGPLLFQPLKKYLREFEWKPAGRSVRVVPAMLGDRAGAFGAAWRAMHLNED